MADILERLGRSNELGGDVYSRLLKERIIWVGSKIDATVANNVMAQLLFLENDDRDEDIYLYINSPGGLVNAGLGIYDAMQFIQPDVVTLCAGSSYGIATLLLSAGAPGKRYALPNAIIHQHLSKTDFSGYAPDVQMEDNQLKALESRIFGLIAAHTNQTLEKVSSDLQRDNFFTPQQALEYGLIDEIVTKNPGL